MLPCWRFLHDHPEDILQRLVAMTRGIADPLASAYCRLYLVQCAQRLPQHDAGANSWSPLLMYIIEYFYVLSSSLVGLLTPLAGQRLTSIENISLFDREFE